MTLRIGEDGEITDGTSPEEVVESMEEEEQEASVMSMVDDMSSDAMEMEEESEAAFVSTMAAKSAIDSTNKKGGTSTEDAKKIAIKAVESFKRLGNLIDKTSRRASSVKKMVSKFSKVSASKKDDTVRKANEVIERANVVSERYVDIKSMISGMNKKFSALFDQNDSVETNFQDYGEYDFDRDTKPKLDSESDVTVKETENDSEEGWLAEQPGVKAKKKARGKNRRLFSKRRKRSDGLGNDLRSDEAEIPTPGTDADMIVDVDLPEDTGLDEGVETMMAALKPKPRRKARSPRKRRATYNDDVEYLDDTEVQENVENMMGEADTDTGDLSEPGMVHGKKKRKQHQKRLTLAQRKSIRLRRKRAEEVDEGELEDVLEDELEDALDVDLDLDLGDEGNEERDARRRNRVRRSSSRKSSKRFNTKLSRKDWLLIKKIAEGEEEESDDEDESEDSSEEKEARRRNRKVKTSRRKRLSKRSSDKANMDFCRKLVKKAAEDEDEDKNEDSDVEAMDFMDDDMLDDSMMPDDNMMLDDSMSYDDDLDIGLDDEMILGEDESKDEEKEALLANKTINEAVKRRNSKFNSAMKLVALEQLRGLRTSKFHKSLVTVLAKDASISEKKADLIVRTAMAYDDSYTGLVDQLVREASITVKEMSNDQQFLKYYNRVASMGGIHDRVIAEGNDELGEDDQELTGTWEDSESFNKKGSHVEASRTASQGRSVEEILKQKGGIVRVTPL